MPALVIWIVVAAESQDPHLTDRLMVVADLADRRAARRDVRPVTAGSGGSCRWCGHLSSVAVAAGHSEGTYCHASSPGGGRRCANRLGHPAPAASGVSHETARRTPRHRDHRRRAPDRCALATTLRR